MRWAGHAARILMRRKRKKVLILLKLQKWENENTEVSYDVKAIDLFVGNLLSWHKSSLFRLSWTHIKKIPYYILLCIYYYYYYFCSALEPVWAGTRAQSGDRYDSGTLHPGQVLRGSLPLLSPEFRRYHFRRQVSPCPQRRERS